MSAQDCGDVPRSDHFCDAHKILIHYPVFIHRRGCGADGGMRLLQGFGGFEWREKVDRLGGSHGLDRENISSVLDHSFSLFAAVIPMETKSSLFPEVVIESTDAG